MSSHRQIFKSTALIGGTQIINILIGIFRIKAIAILLGPAGVGLAGLYQSAIAMIGSVAGLGLNSSGVRQIAEANGSGDLNSISRTSVILRRVSLCSGIAGMTIVIFLAPILSETTFGDRNHILEMMIMSLTLLFGALSAAQGALLQGLRKMRELAASQIGGNIFGALVSVFLVWMMGTSGIVPSLVAVSVFGILSSWWYSRKIRLEPVKVKWKESIKSSGNLLKMGVAFTVAALISSGTGYLTRVLVQRELGMDAVGIYTATWTLSSYYISIVLAAMGADFMPRLTASNHDHKMMNKLVNEQSEMGVLIALPGVIATLALAPYIMKTFYSAQFIQGADVARWQIHGVFLRVVSWPLAYILIAKGKSIQFMISEFLFGITSVIMIFLCMNIWKLSGTGISFALSYLIYAIIMIAITRLSTGFRWTRSSQGVFLTAILFMIAENLILVVLPKSVGSVCGVVLSLLCLLFSFHKIQKLTGMNMILIIKRKIVR
jgi:PST family polysaccharide transporter